MKFLQIPKEPKMYIVQGGNPYKMFLLRMLVAQEKESKLSLDRTLAAIDKVTSESLDKHEHQNDLQ